MASSKPVMCGPCEADNKSSIASIWCHNCKEGLCSICSDQHRKFKATRDHKTIDIDDYSKLPVFIQSIKTDCERHDLPLLLYCPNHLHPCCEECISSEHSKCLGIKLMSSVVEKENLAESVHSLEKEMKSILSVFEKIITSITKNKEARHEKQIGIKENTAKIREEINEILDRLETKFNAELSNIVSKEETRDKDAVREIERKKHNIQEMQQHMELLLKHGSDLQSFLGIYHLTQQIHQNQTYLDDMEKDGAHKTVNIEWKPNKDLKSLLTNFQSLDRLGEVLILKTEIDLERQTKTHKDAQDQSTKTKELGEIYLNFNEPVKYLDTEDPINDMICLTDGRIVAVDDGGDVLVLEADCALQKKLSVGGPVCGVTQTSKDTIAVTLSTEKTVKLINFTNDTITKIIELDKQCYGLSYSNDTIAIGLSDNEVQEIRIIDLNGNKLNSIKVEKQDTITCLFYKDKRVIFTDSRNMVIRCIDMSGCVAWQIEEVHVANGVSSNRYGNIYVADIYRHRILEISNDGKKSETLFIKGYEIGWPRLICFSKDNQHAYLYQQDPYGNYLVKFQVLVK